MNKPTIIVISGPTASGKTEAAMRLFDSMSVELINMDSTQAYIDMDIGTAKPTPAELRAYPHHLLDIRLPTTSYSASEFYQDVLTLVPNIFVRGSVPLLVGGTMMYLHVLYKGLANLPAANVALREELQAQINQEGHQVLRDELMNIDPLTAAKIQGDDTQRLIRFIEIYRLTGRAPSDFFAAQENNLPFTIKHFAIMPDNRAELHERINNRFEQMVGVGLLDELRYLKQKYELTPALSSMRSVGYRQAWSHLSGEIDFDTFLERGKAATRQLAKRQLTWLRKLPKDLTINCASQITVDTVKAMLESA